MAGRPAAHFQLLRQEPDIHSRCSGLVVQRKVARLRVSRDLAGLLLGDLQRAIKHLQKNPAEIAQEPECRWVHHN